MSPPNEEGDEAAHTAALRILHDHQLVPALRLINLPAALVHTQHTETEIRLYGNVHTVKGRGIRGKALLPARNKLTYRKHQTADVEPVVMLLRSSRTGSLSGHIAFKERLCLLHGKPLAVTAIRDFPRNRELVHASRQQQGKQKKQHHMPSAKINNYCRYI